MKDFPDGLVKDPAHPPQLIVFFGYVGKSSVAKATRIYLDAALSTYVDVPDDAIAYRLKLTREESLLEGSYLWLKADASLSFGPARATAPWGLRPAMACVPYTPYVPILPPVHACHPCGNPCSDPYVTIRNPWGYNTPTVGAGPAFGVGPALGVGSVY
jgi:hypothetical protein